MACPRTPKESPSKPSKPNLSHCITLRLAIMAACPLSAKGRFSTRFSVSRNPRLEAFLQARYELDQAAPPEKPASRTRLEAMIKDMLADRKGISARELLAASEDEYREYCRQ